MSNLSQQPLRDSSPMSSHHSGDGTNEQWSEFMGEAEFYLWNVENIVLDRGWRDDPWGKRRRSDVGRVVNRNCL